MRLLALASLQLSDARVRLEKLRGDAELRQKREHLKYMETLITVADSNEGEAPLLTITQQKKELALQGSTELIKQEIISEKERKPSNLPFFQSRKPIYLKVRDTKTAGISTADSNKTVSNSEQDSTKIEAQSRTNPLKIEQPVKPLRGIPSSSSQEKAQLSPSEQARREHFSRLRQAGWIMGLDGKWSKDEDAEFDSDEDEPPPPP